MKPMLASDAVFSKIQYPVLTQPKIDGVRGLVINGRLVGRSLKQHRNQHVTNLLSHRLLDGFDGEIIAGYDPTASDLCRRTSGDVSRIEGQPEITFYVFDWLIEDVRELPYFKRHERLERYLNTLVGRFPVRLVHSELADSEASLDAIDTCNLQAGYEGTILRDPSGTHKQGRSTAKEGGLLRIKRFIEEEAVVLSLEEGRHNGNEAKKNELGRTERSTAQAGMVPNGMVGTLICEDVKTGAVIEVAPGRMTHTERRFFWENPSEIVGHVIKYKHFEVGRKDKPRFPTFQSFRTRSDIA